MTTRKDPDFAPKTVQITGGNVMVSGSILVSAILITGSAFMLKTSFEKRMDNLEWRLDALTKDRWTLPMQRDYNFSLKWENKSTLSVPDVDAIKTRYP